MPVNSFVLLILSQLNANFFFFFGSHNFFLEPIFIIRKQTTDKKIFFFILFLPALKFNLLSDLIDFYTINFYAFNDCSDKTQNGTAPMKHEGNLNTMVNIL